MTPSQRQAVRGPADASCGRPGAPVALDRGLAEETERLPMLSQLTRRLLFVVSAGLAATVYAQSAPPQPVAPAIAPAKSAIPAPAPKPLPGSPPASATPVPA